MLYLHEDIPFSRYGIMYLQFYVIESNFQLHIAIITS